MTLGSRPSTSTLRWSGCGTMPSRTRSSSRADTQPCENFGCNGAPSKPTRSP